MKKSTFVAGNGRRHLYRIVCGQDGHGRNDATGHYNCAVALVPAADGDVACSCRSTLSYVYSHGGAVFQAAVDRAKELDRDMGYQDRVRLSGCGPTTPLVIPKI